MPLVAAYYTVRRYIRGTLAASSDEVTTRDAAGWSERWCERGAEPRARRVWLFCVTSGFWSLRTRASRLVYRLHRGSDAAVPSDRRPWRRAAVPQTPGPLSSLSSW